MALWGVQKKSQNVRRRWTDEDNGTNLRFEVCGWCTSNMDGGRRGISDNRRRKDF